MPAPDASGGSVVNRGDKLLGARDHAYETSTGPTCRWFNLPAITCRSCRESSGDAVFPERGTMRHTRAAGAPS